MALVLTKGSMGGLAAALLVSVAGCSGPTGPEASSAPDSYNKGPAPELMGGTPAPAGDGSGLLGGPATTSSTLPAAEAATSSSASRLKTYRRADGMLVTAMAPVKNPEDMTAAERRQVYGNRYAPRAHVSTGGRARRVSAEPAQVSAPAPVKPAVVKAPAPKPVAKPAAPVVVAKPAAPVVAAKPMAPAAPIKVVPTPPATESAAATPAPKPAVDAPVLAQAPAAPPVVEAPAAPAAVADAAPAAKPAAIPTVVSSTTKQRAGSICKCAAAARYTSG